MIQMKQENEILTSLEKGLIRIGHTGFEVMYDSPKIELIIINAGCN